MKNRKIALMVIRVSRLFRCKKSEIKNMTNTKNMIGNVS